MCNFKVGQKIVGIQSGTIYVVKGIRKSVCKCTPDELNVGELTSETHISCSGCGMTDIPDFTGIGWSCSSLFRPLISDYTESEIAEVDISPLIEELELETV